MMPKCASQLSPIRKHTERRAVVRAIVKPMLCGTDPFLDTLFLFPHCLLYPPSTLGMRQHLPTTTTIHFPIRIGQPLRVCRMNKLPMRHIYCSCRYGLLSRTTVSCPVSVRHRLDFLTTITTTSTIIREQLRGIPDKIQSVVQIESLLRLVFTWFQQRGKSRRKQTFLARL